MYICPSLPQEKIVRGLKIPSLGMQTDVHKLDEAQGGYVSSSVLYQCKGILG